MGKKIYKNFIEYICPNCLKNKLRKSEADGYNSHDKSDD